ncbi:hypothetical protein TWF696_006505 [Orbilia brochopaga]|uniref:Uncharacterized protein n=1 Tax=Orbilia brochopaga TaxID=3140254 RepID=A0AAV9UWI7_9PEZI
MDSGPLRTTAEALSGKPGFAFPSEEAQEEMARQLAEKKKQEGEFQTQDKTAGDSQKKEDKSAKGQ